MGRARLFNARRHLEFQSTHPVWDGTLKIQKGGWIIKISIHPSRVGWDLQHMGYDRSLRISIHPSRVGWDDNFFDFIEGNTISIHPSRVGWDESTLLNLTLLINFNPPIPCGMGPEAVRAA